MCFCGCCFVRLFSFSSSYVAGIEIIIIIDNFYSIHCLTFLHCYTLPSPFLGGLFCIVIHSPLHFFKYIFLQGANNVYSFPTEEITILLLLLLPPPPPLLLFCLLLLLLLINRKPIVHGTSALRLISPILPHTVRPPRFTRALKSNLPHLRNTGEPT